VLSGDRLTRGLIMSNWCNRWIPNLKPVVGRQFSSVVIEPDTEVQCESAIYRNRIIQEDSEIVRSGTVLPRRLLHEILIAAIIVGIETIRSKTIDTVIGTAGILNAELELVLRAQEIVRIVRSLRAERASPGSVIPRVIHAAGICCWTSIGRTVVYKWI